MQIIDQFVAKLRHQVKLEIQQCWYDVTGLDIDVKKTRIDLKQYQYAQLNDKNYLVFAQGRQVKYLAQKIVIPSTLAGYPLSGLNLRLVLTWWAEDAQIFINGELKQQGDLFDSSARVLITNNAQPGEEYLVIIRLVSPNHDIGALMRSHLLYEQPFDVDDLDPGLVADEITVLAKYLSQFEPQHLNVLAGALDKFDWNNLANANRFVYDLGKLRSSLLSLGINIKQRCFNLLGHAHLDMAWLWTTAETYEIAQRTFKSVLSLQQNFPNLIFGHTSPALYEWMEENNPHLLEEIRQAVDLDRWELLGGMWIEPETNLISGESLIRQLLYGQAYYQKRFGKISTVAWLGDSFGFTWQLPQILKQCGIEYFVTGKLHWNDTTKFPLGCFWWESPDGTRLLTLMSPPNVTGVMDTNPLTMANYAIDWEIQTGLQEIFWLPGVGDHGGGPTRDMLEVASKWSNSPFFPEIKFSRASDYLEVVKGHDNSSDFPIWQDELYLEFHRGCYSSHADQKKYNRFSERLLYEGELWATLATLLCRDRFVGQPLFPIINRISEKEGLCQVGWQELIDIAWKKILFNQFHDILPGTSIPDVYIEANEQWEAALEIGNSVLQAALRAIALNLKLPQPPQADASALVIFNSLNWQRSQIVTVPAKQCSVYNHLGEIVVSESTADEQIIFLAENIPAVGYSLFWLCPKKSPPEKQSIKLQEYILENQYLRVTINQDNGNLDSIYDLKNQREILSGQGNELQNYQDQGQYWDAWNIDPNYQQKRLDDWQLKSINWLETGKLRQTIRVIKQFGQSQFTQDYILHKDSPLLTIKNQVDWQQTHIMVKTAFPFQINSDLVTYEIPCATITRTTNPKTAAEAAKWEVSALNWADLTDNQGEYGVSLINDCKYGYDAQAQQLRLTLLRSPTWPDPQSDNGRHNFSYAIYPHKSNWQTAKTVQKGYEFITPLQIIKLNPDEFNSGGQLPPMSELLNLTANNLILMALKPLNTQELVMRFYEAEGKTSELEISSDLKIKLIKKVDCLERNQDLPSNQDKKVEPYKIITWVLKIDE
ncbi:glycosyl hydrolase 38 domain protein [Chondrocystis sp. NIES-4102]|nr:glycosyl hydrolase 38 domain protein [Chondrocystis sp. NIES-4102]